MRLPKTNRTLSQALALNYRVAPHIDQFLENNPEYAWEAKFSPKIADDAWHPSGDCTPSVYDLWLKATGRVEYKPTSLSLKKTFNVGHYFHQWIQDILVRIEFAVPESLERRGGTKWGECTINQDGLTPQSAWSLWPVNDIPGTPWAGAYKPAPYHWATGSADVAPCILADSTHVLLDIKSISSVDAKTDAPPTRFVDKWECQANIYLDWFDLDEAIFLGVNKEAPHNFREWVFRRNQPLIDAIYEKWKIVSLAIDEGIELNEGDDIELPLIGAQG